jgi:8-oxo-dGTP diphosphatase/2-hydroxy-dATP diphosphatase
MAAFRRKVLTLAMVFQNDRNEVLLGMKKRGFGMGKWNGFGGKIEPGETIPQATVRGTTLCSLCAVLSDCSFTELREEAGVTVAAQYLKQHGLLEFEMRPEERDEETEILEVHVFKIDHQNTEGEPLETEEMKPQWFPLNAVPYHQMWPDDKYWYPLLFQNKFFQGYFVFQGHDNILSHDLREVDEKFDWSAVQTHGK